MRTNRPSLLDKSTEPDNIFFCVITPYRIFGLVVNLWIRQVALGLSSA